MLTLSFIYTLIIFVSIVLGGFLINFLVNFIGSLGIFLLLVSILIFSAVWGLVYDSLKTKEGNNEN